MVSILGLTLDGGIKQSLIKFFFHAGLSLPLYEQLLEKPGREVNYDLNGHVVEDRSGTKDPGALVAVETYVPGQVFESQKGSIAVSLWKHWKS